ncbi:MAG TPA: hypothetical protein VGK79_16495 [Gaiellaceae bacterium]
MLQLKTPTFRASHGQVFHHPRRILVTIFSSSAQASAALREPRVKAFLRQARWRSVRQANVLVFVLLDAPKGDVAAAKAAMKDLAG